MRSRSILIAFLSTVAAASPALAAETRLIDVTNERWIEVTGEGAVSAAPDFARVTLGVTTAGKDAGEAMAANAKAANALVALIKSEGVAPRRHPDLGDVDFAGILAAAAQSSPRTGDHRL